MMQRWCNTCMDLHKSNEACPKLHSFNFEEIEVRVLASKIERIKRRAKRIKKDNGIPHHKALDEAAKEEGFKDWNELTYKNKG